MSKVTWKVSQRVAGGKGAARKLRALGKLPANVYGKGLDNIALAIDSESVEQLIHQGNWNLALITLEGDGLDTLGGKIFIIKEMQRHHVSGNPQALDFLMIQLDKAIIVDIPLIYHGGEEIKKLGGLLDVQHRTLAIKCLPTAIPEQIDIDVSELYLGQTLHLVDITLPEGVTTELPDDYPLCTAHIPRLVVEEEVEPEEGEEGEAVEGAEGEEKKEDEKKEDEKKAKK